MHLCCSGWDDAAHSETDKGNVPVPEGWPGNRERHKWASSSTAKLSSLSIFPFNEPPLLTSTLVSNSTWKKLFVIQYKKKNNNHIQPRSCYSGRVHSYLGTQHPWHGVVHVDLNTLEATDWSTIVPSVLLHALLSDYTASERSLHSQRAQRCSCIHFHKNLIMQWPQKNFLLFLFPYFFLMVL